MLKTVTFRDRFARTATKDIICYKTMCLTNDSNVVTSPFQKYSFRLGESTVSKLSSPLLSGNIDYGLHAFINRQDAVSVAESLTTHSRQRATFDYIMNEYGFYDTKFSERTWGYIVSTQYDHVNAVWRKLSTSEYSTYAAFECRVPSGAKYYKGIWESKRHGTLPNIASDTMVIMHNVDNHTPPPADTYTEVGPEIVSLVDKLLSQAAESFS